MATIEGSVIYELAFEEEATGMKTAVAMTKVCAILIFLMKAIHAAPSQMDTNLGLDNDLDYDLVR